MRRHAVKPPDRPSIIGRRVRISAEGQVEGRYEACSTAPERVMVRIDGIITMVPVARVELLP